MRKSIIDKILALTVSSFIIKILGFVFRIYLSNAIGSEGMGLYQLILSVYALGATFSTSGISVAISRLTAMNERYAGRILKAGIIITEFISFIVTMIICSNAEYIGLYFIKDIRTVKSIRVVALSFPAISLFACLSGYFNGLTKVKYPMRGQIAEQAVRIIFIFAVISKAVKNSMESALLVTSVGIVLGEYLSLMYLYLKYRWNLKNEREVYTNRGFFLDLLKISMPVSVNGYFNSFLHTLESMLLPDRFMLYGYTHKEAITFLGMIKGMAMPLVFFPTVVLGAVSTVSLPHISKAQSQHNTEGVKRAVRKSLTLASVTGLGVMVVFLLFSKQICTLLYGSDEVSHTLKCLSILVPMMYINIVAVGILNGLGKQLQLMVIGIIEGIIKIAAICILIPVFGFYGYVWSLAICEAAGTIFYIINIQKNAKVIKC